MKEGKEYIIRFPRASEEGNKPMSLFYGAKTDTGGINWKVDSNSLLKLVPTVHTVGWMGTAFPDSIEYKGLYIAGPTPISISDYVERNFDVQKLDTQPDTRSYYDINFVVDTTGKIGHIKMERTRFIDTDTGVATLTDKEVPAYVKKFVEQIPNLVSLKAEWNETYIAFPADCHFTIDFQLVAASAEPGPNYSEAFRKKYAAFSNTSISTMNENELNYYSFSASKLGWINCDYFINSPGPLINFAVKPMEKTKSDIKLIFKKTSSIMQGQKQGGNIVFANIPAGQEVKIVAIAFKGNQPLLAIAHTKTSKEVFSQLEFKEFSLADLDKALSEN